jgi:pyruvate/2-oxoglutarate dehydrogenase complex dihydrolipoamide acyltransferase (E2) component
MLASLFKQAPTVLSSGKLRPQHCPAAGNVKSGRAHRPIGEVIAYILKPGEELPAEKAAPAKPAAAPPAETALPAKTTPVAERVARSHGIDVQTVAPASASPGPMLKRV